MLVRTVVRVEGLNDAGLTSLTEVLVLVMMFINNHCKEIAKITVFMDDSTDLFCMPQQPLVGQGLVTVETSLRHVTLVWTVEEPEEEGST
jgi:hypothetical protein